MRPINEVVIHCSATKPDWMEGATLPAKTAEIKRWHVEGNGWSDIGYHYLIDRNGYIGKGRPVSRIGAHVRGRNKGTIGVCLIGGHGSASTDQFSEHFTSQQDASLRRLLNDLHGTHGKLAITGHNQFAAKACPGFTVAKWLNQAPPEPKQSSGLAALIGKFFAALFKRK